MAPCPASAMVSNCLRSTGTVLALCLALTACSGRGGGDGDGSGAGGRSGSASSDTADLDRILAGHPDAANAGELRRLRAELQQQRRDQPAESRRRLIGQERDPHDRRRWVEASPADRLGRRPAREVQRRDRRDEERRQAFLDALDSGPMRVDPLY